MKKTLASLLLTGLFLTACGGGTKTDTLSEKGDKALDQQFYDQAIQSNNVSLCDQIIDNNIKGECKSILKAGEITKKAISDVNIDLCKTIDLERYKKTCTIRVQSLADSAQKEEDISKIEKEAMDNKDVELCNKVENESERASCKYNILANQAIEKKDPSICEGIGQKSSIEECKKTAEGSIKN